MTTGCGIAMDAQLGSLCCEVMVALAVRLACYSGTLVQSSLSSISDEACPGRLESSVIDGIG